MDIILHWGVLKKLRKTIKSNSLIVGTAIVFDIVVLRAFLWLKATTDLFVVVISMIVMVAIFVGGSIIYSLSLPLNNQNCRFYDSGTFLTHSLGLDSQGCLFHLC